MAEAKKTTSKAKAVTTTKVAKPVVAEKAVAKAKTTKATKPAKAAKPSTTEQVVVEAVQDEVVAEKVTKILAKAGKRSSKALEEVAEKQTKEDRKASHEDEDAKPKQASQPTRTRDERRGKLFQKSAALIEKDKLYTLEEAIDLAKQTSHVKFDASVELHVNLNVDPRHADQNIRDNLVLPFGTGKTVRIVVLTDDAATAIKSGADLAGNEEVLAELDKGNLNFDILIAIPSLMPKLGKYARTLGPRGLMPNPKSGTVTTDVNKAVAEAKAGRIEYRVDNTGIVHLMVGKVSFEATPLLNNVQAVIASIKSNKPASVKSNYFKAVHLTTSMGPSIKVDLASVN